MRRKIVVYAAFYLCAAWAELPVLSGAAENEFCRTLKDSWVIQSSAKVAAGGESVSKPGFPTRGWYPASVPSTVLAALVKNNVYKDIFFADNLMSVSPDPFKVSWWFRTEFVLPSDPPGASIRIEFDGINYRANIWLNGKKIGDAASIYGAFRRFSIDATGSVKFGEKNALAVEVFPAKPGDPTIGFVDWNPQPPDNSLGLWREVKLRTAGDVSIDAPFIETKVDLNSLREAKLSVSAELRNNTAKIIAGNVEGRIESAVFSKSVTLQPNEVRKVTFFPGSDPQLVFKNPRLWWTHDLGKPDLYQLDLNFKAAGRVSDSVGVRFGIRDVSDYFNEQGQRGFKLNGKKVLIRGGGWTDDMLLDNPYPKVKAQVEYARQMNLNALRVEGFWGTSQDLYDLCDEMGILVMAGWSCQWEWAHYLGKPTDEKFGGIQTPGDIKLVARYWKDQVRWLRNHPSIFVWMMASDLLPLPELEKEYRKILAEDDPTRPSLISAAARVSTLSGKSGVKMNGPYEYVSPNYWYLDKKNGGAFGFNTETGPGPQVPPLESLKKMFPEKSLWPINDLWNFHCCRGKFNNLDVYNNAMAMRLGPANNLENYLAKAQYLNYEGLRAMFEAFVANRHTATGIIQWMYNSAWPKLWWQLFGYDLLPNGAFFGARKACEPVHILYRYDSGEIVATNAGLQPSGKLKATVRILNSDGKEKAKSETTIELGPDEIKTLAKTPRPEGLSSTYFLDLRLHDAKDQLITANCYALSTQPDVLDEAKGNWYMMPLKEYANLTGLEKLPPVRLKSVDRFVTGGQGMMAVTVELLNPASHPAFMIELMVVGQETGEAATPIFWDDNYLTLLPGEKRTVRGSFPAEALGGSRPKLKISGWNIR